jgi:hypothetical protein
MKNRLNKALQQPLYPLCHNYFDYFSHYSHYGNNYFSLCHHYSNYVCLYGNNYFSLCHNYSNYFCHNYSNDFRNYTHYGKKNDICAGIHSSNHANRHLHHRGLEFPTTNRRINSFWDHQGPGVYSHRDCRASHYNFKLKKISKPIMKKFFIIGSSL